MPIFVFALASEARSAPAELCPVYINLPVAIGHPDLPASPDRRYAFILEGDHSDPVAATIAFYSAGKLYRKTFDHLAMHKVVHKGLRYRIPEFEFSDYQSDPQYVSFAQPVKLEASWIRSAGLAGAPPSPCPPLVAAPSEKKPDVSDGWEFENGPTAAQIAAGAPAETAAAEFDSVADAGTCPNVFIQARTVDAVTPEYPAVLRDRGLPNGKDFLIDLIRIVIDKNGDLLDSSFLVKTGVESADREALLSARRSRYLPAKLFCKPTPGTYTFRAIFTAP